MVSEVFDLYKSISRHDKSVVRNLKKINAELLQTVTEGRNFNLEESRRYQLSAVMLGVLQTYNQMVFLTETTLKNLRLKLMQIHRDSLSEKEGFQNLPEPALKPVVENKTLSLSKKSQLKSQKIQYTPADLFKMNPYGQGTAPVKSRDKNEWKAIPTSLLKNYKEKQAVYEIRDNFARKNDQLKTLWEDKEKEVATEATKSIKPEDGVINDETSTNRQVEDLPILSNGDTMSILVTGYKTTCHFYAQIFGKYSYQYSELLGQMNSSSMVETYIPFKVYPEIGQLLLTKHNTLWYRARCLSKGHGQIKVFLVDVGITVMKKMADIAQMADDFLRFPFYALECVLDGVCERSEVLAEKSRKVFEKVMLQKRFTVLVVDSGIPIRLKMYDAKGLDMCYVLKMYGIV